MKNLKIKFGKLGTMLSAVSMVWFIGSCSDKWDDHYENTGSKGSGDKTLWEEINSRPELQDFAAQLKKTGYDEILDANQMYTVWAPAGSIESDNLNEEEITKEIVENHVSRFAYSAYPAVQENILMLNNKIMGFAESSPEYTFSSVALSEKNIIARNGVLHIIEKPADYFNNLWEYLNRGSELDSLKNFMYSFTKKEFDEENSVESGVVDGMTIYADSAMIETNILWRRLGYLPKEDSSYLFIAPTNKAWREAYDRIRQYYVFSDTVAKRDSLQDYYTKYAIVKDLIFSLSNNTSLKDSVISTSGNVFDKPQEYLFADYPDFDNPDGGIACSNGRLYPADSLRHRPWDSWQKKILVEAENTNLRSDYTGCNVYPRDVAAGSSYSKKISSNQYLEVSPANSAVNPTVTFEVPNVLSAGYDVYCIFVPAYVANEKTKSAKPSIVRFQLSYSKNNGSAGTHTRMDTIFKNDLRAIDTVLVAENFVFPTANYNQNKTTTLLKIMTSVSRTQTTTFTRSLLLDCIYLKPHQN